MNTASLVDEGFMAYMVGMVKDRRMLVIMEAVYLVNIQSVVGKFGMIWLICWIK